MLSISTGMPIGSVAMPSALRAGSFSAPNTSSSRPFAPSATLGCCVKDETAALLRAGLNENHARLITELYDAQNEGRIDVEVGNSERRFGETELVEVFASLRAALNAS
ncbi:hypothetical protein P3T21_002254 [Paraburkholderia sp. GAS334]|jgi:hypothetical protein